MISCLFPRWNKRRVNGGKSNRSMLSLFTKSTPCVFVPNFLFISQALSIYPQFVLLSRVYQTIKCECLITPELVMLSCVSYQWCWSSQCLTGSFTFCDEIIPCVSSKSSSCQISILNRNGAANSKAMDHLPRIYLMLLFKFMFMCHICQLPEGISTRLFAGWVIGCKLEGNHIMLLWPPPH